MYDPLNGSTDTCLHTFWSLGRSDDYCSERSECSCIEKRDDPNEKKRKKKFTMRKERRESMRTNERYLKMKKEWRWTKRMLTCLSRITKR